MKDVQKRETTIIQVNNFYKVTEVIILKSQSVDCLDLEQTYQLQHLDFRALLWTHLLLLLERGWALVVQEGPQQAVRTNFWEGAWVAVALRKKLLVWFFFFFNCFGSSSVVCVELQTDGGCDQLLGQCLLLQIAISCLLQGKVAGWIEASGWQHRGLHCSRCKFSDACLYPFRY